ncbi:MAG: type II toxin-antitoxin system HicB family antitoxin [Clostridiales bacterium]|nr:type II toxin-antitoxin system HicB family antitoxin [Clostridiales bacterium]
MIKAYPVILTPDNGGFVVYVPDLRINTEGNNLAEALYMACDAIGAWALCEEDAGRAIPEPSAVQPRHEDNEIVSWVDIDFEKYRRENDMTCERINVSIPRYLKNSAREAGLNISQELRERLEEVLRAAK